MVQKTQPTHICIPFLCHSAKADFYPFVLRTPGIKEMAQNESVNQIANYVERKKITALAAHRVKTAQNNA
jgi:hypothetical protein